VLKRPAAVLPVLVPVLSCAGFGEAASAKRLKKGSRGEAVKKLRTALREQGCQPNKMMRKCPSARTASYLR